MIPEFPQWAMDLQPWLIFVGLLFAVVAGIQLMITMTRRKRHDKKEREDEDGDD